MACSDCSCPFAGTSARDPNFGLRVNEQGNVWVPQRARPRRNRKNEGVRSQVRENEVKPSNLIYPLFFHTLDSNEPIPSMPGCERHTSASVMKEVGEAVAEGVQNIILFPKVPEELKTNAADECYNPNGMVPKMISEIKEKYGQQVNVWTDVALDPYSDQGHDGMVSSDKRGDGGMVRSPISFPGMIMFMMMAANNSPKNILGAQEHTHTYTYTHIHTHRTLTL